VQEWVLLDVTEFGSQCPDHTGHLAMLISTPHMDESNSLALLCQAVFMGIPGHIDIPLPNQRLHIVPSGNVSPLLTMLIATVRVQLGSTDDHGFREEDLGVQARLIDSEDE